MYGELLQRNVLIDKKTLIYIELFPHIEHFLTMKYISNIRTNFRL